MSAEATFQAPAHAAANPAGEANAAPGGVTCASCGTVWSSKSCPECGHPRIMPRRGQSPAGRGPCALPGPRSGARRLRMQPALPGRQGTAGWSDSMACVQRQCRHVWPDRLGADLT
jgi:hypothetical protein